MKLKKNVIIILILVGIGTLSIIGFLLFSNKNNDKEFRGLWTIDGYTSYEFSENKKGNLVLPHLKKEFTYKVKDDKLCIDFKDKNAIDKCYKYVFNNEKLVMTDEDKNVFNLKKVEK